MVIHVRSFGLLQKLPESIHHLLFMLHKGVGVTVESNSRVFVSEDLGQCFYIHAAFKGAGGESVPQGMKSFVRNIQFFEEQFKTSLVGTDGN